MAYHRVLANLAMKKHVALLYGVMSCDCRSQAFLVLQAGFWLGWVLVQRPWSCRATWSR